MGWLIRTVSCHSAAVDVCVDRVGNKLAVNLVNTSGAHWDRKNPLIEPVGPLELTIRVWRSLHT